MDSSKYSSLPRGFFTPLALLSWSLLVVAVEPSPPSASECYDYHASSFNAFPIVMYNSDIGYGFGGKGVLKNSLRKDESFDLILFGSSKGEQWYAFNFSLPDREIRQGTVYPHALDVKIEYDKFLKSNFFGIGNVSPDNEHQFPKEDAKLEISDSRAFSKTVVGELGLRLATYSVYGWDPRWQTINSPTPGIGQSQICAIAGALRWDDRDSQINPHTGKRLELRLEYSPKVLNDAIRQGKDASNGQQAPDWSFTKARLEYSHVTAFYFPCIPVRRLRTYYILAWRVWLQEVYGSAPYNELSFLGGGSTLRGYKYERLLDDASALASLELRLSLGRLLIPNTITESLMNAVRERLGGVIFLDAGRVASGMGKMSLKHWYWDYGVGLRYDMKDFVVRGDVGESAEGMRLFLNFGQVF